IPESAIILKQVRVKAVGIPSSTALRSRWPAVVPSLSVLSGSTRSSGNIHLPPASSSRLWLTLFRIVDLPTPDGPRISTRRNVIKIQPPPWPIVRRNVPPDRASTPYRVAHWRELRLQHRKV